MVGFAVVFDCRVLAEKSFLPNLSMLVPRFTSIVAGKDRGDARREYEYFFADGIEIHHVSSVFEFGGLRPGQTRIG